MRPKIEVIIPCVNYADFLEITLPLNKNQLNNLIVITTKSDIKTQKVCHDNDIRFLFTDLFYKGFNFDRGRAKASSWALNYLKYKDWVLFLDADCILPQDFKKKFVSSNLDKEYFYGTSRRMIYSYKDYLAYTNKEKTLDSFEKLCHYGCGYFQMFSLQSSVVKKYKLENLYPSDNNLNDNSDIELMKRWGQKTFNDHLVRLEIDLIHLGYPIIFNNGRTNKKRFQDI